MFGVVFPRVTLPVFRPLLAMLGVSVGVTSLSATPVPAAAQAFIEAHCASCHDEVDKEGGLDLTALTLQPDA